MTKKSHSILYNGLIKYSVPVTEMLMYSYCTQSGIGASLPKKTKPPGRVPLFFSFFLPSSGSCYSMYISSGQAQRLRPIRRARAADAPGEFELACLRKRKKTPAWANGSARTLPVSEAKASGPRRGRRSWVSPSWMVGPSWFWSLSAAPVAFSVCWMSA